MSLFFKAELFDILSKLYSEERVLNHIETLKKLESPRGYSAFGDATLWCEDVLKKEEEGIEAFTREASKFLLY